MAATPASPRPAVCWLVAALTVFLGLAVPVARASAGPAGSWYTYPPGVAPADRENSTAVLDTRRGRVIVIAGTHHTFFHAPISTYYHDTWSLDPASGQYSLLVPADSVALNGAEYGAAVYDSLTDRVFYFGGINYLLTTYGALTEPATEDQTVWVLDLSQPTGWHAMPIPGTPPPSQRAGHTLLLDAPRRRLVLFGGWAGVAGSRMVVDDVWTLALDGATPWTKITPVGPFPPARWGQGAIMDVTRDRMVIHGGVGANGAQLSDTWALTLSDPMTWNQLQSGGGPAGRAPAFLDAANHRMVSFSDSTTPPYLVPWEMDLDAVPGWRNLPMLPGQGPGFSAIDHVLPGVFDPASHRAPLLFTNALDLTPPPPVHLTATVTGPSYSNGTTFLDWAVDSDRTLYSPLKVSRSDGNTTIQVPNVYTAANGQLEMADLTAHAGTHYDYGLVWFSSAGEETLSFAVDTAPPPAHLNATVDSLLQRGANIYAQWIVPADSANLLAPISVQRTLNGGPWETLLTAFPTAHHLRITDEDVGASHYDYRLEWGDPLFQRTEAETTLVTKAVPIWRRGYYRTGFLLAEWRFPSGVPFQATVFRNDQAGNTLTPDAYGIIRYFEPTFTGGLPIVELGWDEGGALRTTTPAVWSYLDTGTLSASGTTTGIDLHITPAPVDTLQPLFLERRDATSGFAVVSTMNPPPTTQTVFHDGGAVPGTHYTYRLRWQLADTTLTSDEVGAARSVSDVPLSSLSAGSWYTYPPGVVPSERENATAVLDSRRDRVLLMAGAYHGFYHQAYTVNYHATDALDPASGAWTSLLPSDSTLLDGVEYAASAYDSLTDRVYFLGGADVEPGTGGFQLRGQNVWVLDLSQSGTWQVLATTGSVPASRAGHSLVLDAPRRRLLLFGGQHGDGLHSAPLNDLWALSLDGSAQWTQLAPTGSPPLPRWRHAAIMDLEHDRMIVQGGIAMDGSELSDTWALSLMGTPAWSELLPQGPAPPGGSSGVFDAAAHRMIVFRDSTRTTAPYTSSVIPWAMDLDAVPAWTVLPVLPGQTAPAANRYSIAGGAFDPVTRRVPVMFGSALDLSPLARVHLTATVHGPSFVSGTTFLDWAVSSDQPLYEPLQVARSDGAAVVAVPSVYPIPSGWIEMADPGAEPGRHYDYGLVWFNSAGYDTLHFPVDTPPAPNRLSSVVDSLIQRGGDIWVTWRVPSDSASWLSPVAMQRRIDGGAWQTIASGFPASHQFRGVDRSVQSSRAYGYRLAWGQYAEAETTLVTNPAPVWRRGYARTGCLVAEWRYPAGVPFRAALSPQGWNSPADTLQTDAYGIIQYVDHAFIYNGGTPAPYLLWNEGGATRHSADPGSFTYLATNLLTAVSTAAGIELHITTPPVDTLQPLLIERRDATSAFATVGTLSPVPPGEAVFVDASTGSASEYTYRLRWRFADSTLTSDEVGATSGVFSLALSSLSANPATDHVRVRAALPGTAPARLELFDIMGRRVRSTSVPGPGTRDVDLDVATLNAGVYIVRLAQANDTRTLRVVLAR